MHRFWAGGKHSPTVGRIAILSAILSVVPGCGADNSGGGVQAPLTQASGTVTGLVVSSANNAPVSGATVRTDSSATTTATDGTFNVLAPAGDRTIVRVEANGFADALPIAHVTEGQISTLGIRLVPIGFTTTVSVTAGGTVSVLNSTARVTIPGNSLVPQAGGTPAGSVTVSLTPLNPAVDTNLMPGGFNGISIGRGSAQRLEGFGVLLIDIHDDTGVRYDLAPGKTATIRIPLGTQSINPPSTIPLWFLDETAGGWREESTATLQGSGANRFYEGDITRVAYWNADQVLETIVVHGCVKDASGQVVARALVEFKGVNYTGTAITLTGGDGTFAVAMRKNGEAELRVLEHDPYTSALVPVSTIVKIGPSSTDLSLTDCLVKQPLPLAIRNKILPVGKVGDAYHQRLAASGGVPGYVWCLNAGSNPLPDSLRLDPSGVILGTPTKAETKTIVLKVTDSAGATTTKKFILTISELTTSPLSIETTAIPSLIVGAAYNTTVIATGGTGLKSWVISAGKLPEGLKLDPASGMISGSSMLLGSFPFIITVHDSGTPQQSARQPLNLVVHVRGG